MKCEVEKPSFTMVGHCRACRSKNVLNLEITRHFHLMNLGQTVEIPYSICQDCSFLFHGKYVGDEFLNYYYRNSPMLRRKEMTKYEVDQNVRQSAFLSAHVEVNGLDVLEIGAHTGAFLVHLNQKFGCNSYYDELSEEALKVLASQKNLIDFRSATKDKKMDVIILRHILEHIYDLDGFLDYVKKVLEPEGSLFIEVPDWSWLDENTDPLMFEHINQFNTGNLILLMERSGWICEAVEKSICADDPATSNRVQRFIFRPLLGDISCPVERFRAFYQEHLEGGNRRIDEFVSSVGESKRIALYPASHLTFSALHDTSIGQANIVGMFDIDSSKKGKHVAGIEIFQAEDLKKVQPDIILLFTMSYENEIRKSFIDMGLEAEVISFTQL